MKRIVWIDYAKSMAIFLVVLLHVHCTYEVSKIINAMIMPMFFMLSGYLFSYDRNPSQLRFVRKRLRQLLVPYLWINIVAWMAWVIILRHFGEDAASEIEWHTPLRGIFIGVAPMLVHDIPLWSLLSFFVVEMVFYPLGRKIPWACAIGLIALALSLGLYVFFPERISSLPLVIGPSLAGLVFYTLGYLWHRAESVWQINTVVFGWPATVIYILIFAVAFDANGYVDFYLCHFGDYFLFFISSLTGSLAVISLMRGLASLIGNSRLVCFISDGTLIICGFHLLVFAAIKGIALFIFGLQPEQITKGLLPGSVFAITAFAATLPIVWFVRRFMLVLVDK